MEDEEKELVFADETTIYRQPPVGRSYYPAGRRQPPAWKAPHYDSKRRISASLNVKDGRVQFISRSKIGVEGLKIFIRELSKFYQKAKKIYLVWDNWVIHTNPGVLEYLSRFPRIEVLWLPTYAPWTNAIEKLWLKLKEEVIVMHRYSDNWEGLKKKVDEFLGGYESGSSELLHYVGLA
jgi:transposase